MSTITLSQATVIIEDFLNKPQKEMPRILNKAVNVWVREFTFYVNGIDESTPHRIQRLIKQLMEMHVKALGIVFALEGCSTIASDLIRDPNGNTGANAAKIVATTDYMLRKLYKLPVELGTAE